LYMTGNMTGVGGLVMGGGGSLVLGGKDNYGDTNVTDGTLTVSNVILSNNVTVAAPGNLIVNGSLSTAVVLTANGSVNFGSNTGTTVVARTLGSVSIGNGGTVVLAANSDSNRTVLITQGLTLASANGAWTGKLDLNDNDMIIQNGNLANIVSQLKEGFNAGAGYWNGSGGIVSSSAATATNYLTTLGVIQNDNGSGTPLYGTGDLYGPFDGQSPGDAAVLVKYTYYGDADLNGVIDGRDYSRIDIGFAEHLRGWVNGDFNYDGVIDGSDYSLIDNAFNAQSGSLLGLTAGASAMTASSASLSVPEPGSLGFLGIVCIAGALSRRRASGTR
jgi:PEP-CTERM motif